MRICQVEGCNKPASKRGITCGPECAHAYRYGSVPVEQKKALPVEEEHRLKRENTKLKSDVSDLSQKLSENLKLNGFINGLLAREIGDVPAWVFTPRAKSKQGIPTAFLSDTHFGEVVFPEQVEYLNGYDRKIAGDRLKRFFENTVSLSREYLAGVNYPGIVLPLGGDIFSGDIHEELDKTNEGTIQQEILYWIDPMLAGIKMLADEFGKVFIPVVPGNHPRGTKKPAHKMRVPNNFDWLFACLLEKFLAHDKRVQFRISPSADCDYSVYSTRYRLTHGDQFRGGSGIAGMLSPLMIGDARKRKRAQAANKPYDYLILGHWHQRAKFKNIIVNGSLKGTDEYSYDSNFDLEPPVQSFWITDPEHGMTIEAPIHVLGKNESWMKNRTIDSIFS